MEDPFEGCIKDYSSSVIVQKTRCDLLVKVRSFSSSHPQQVHSVEYYTSSIYFENYFWLKVYPNGMTNSDKGYISIYFSGTDEYNSVNIIKYFKFDCVVCILDVEGNKKLPQSFIYEYIPSTLGNKNVLPPFGFNKYMSREAFLREPSDYLPEDTLTIHFEINMLEHFMDIDYSFDVEDLMVLESAFKTDSGPDGVNSYYLCLDSVLATYLCAASIYFRKVAGTQMTEKSSRYVYIPAEEYPYFLNIFLILKRSAFMIDKRNFDISQLYAIANKYDFPHVMAACRNLLKTYVSFENVSDMSKLAERFDDIYLKEIVKNFTKVNGENVETASSVTELQAESLKMEWCTKPRDMHLETFHHRKNCEVEQE